MIEEQYISFETAKLAKEKGFNELCNSDYCKGLINYPHADNEYTNSQISEDGRISRPTQALLAMWLREKYNLHVGVGFCANWRYIIIPITDKIIANWSTSEKSYSTYEEAMEIGLQEALKLI